MNNWFYQNIPFEIIPTNCFGFVYLITNNITNRKYIGQKQLYFYISKIETKILKNGKTKKSKVKHFYESDWKTYFGSSTELSSDIQKYGFDNFSREIIDLAYRGKNELNYKEAKAIFDYGALESSDFYNKWASFRCTKLI